MYLFFLCIYVLRSCVCSATHSRALYIFVFVAMAPKVMRAAAKAVANGFCVWMKNAAGVSTRIRVIGNPRVKDFIIDVMDVLTDMSEDEILGDMPNLYMATLAGRILAKRSRLIMLVDNGSHVEVLRRELVVGRGPHVQSLDVTARAAA